MIYKFIFILTCITSTYSQSDSIFSVQLYFGLSKPNGGSVSLNEWNKFEKSIATTFKGFNVIESVGYYKGKIERSKIITLIISKGELDNVKQIAKKYTKMFSQESVMLVKSPVLEWSFITPNTQLLKN